MLCFYTEANLKPQILLVYKKLAISKLKSQKFVFTLTIVLIKTDISSFAHITSQSQTSNLKKRLT